MDKVTSKTDSNNNETKYEYDFRGNLIKVTEPMGNSISYTYDCNDNLTSIIKSKGTVDYLYDGCGNVITEKNEVGKKEYEYDCFGNVLREKNNNGSIEYSYDLNSNNIRKTVCTLSRVEENKYLYDNNDKLIGFSTDVNSKNINTVSINRDALSNVISVCDGDKTVEYGYDEDYNNTFVTYPNGDKVSYEYNNNGNVKTIKTPKNTFECEYDSFDEIISKSSNKINEKFKYDKLGRLTKTYEDDVLRESLEYDSVGNVILKEEYKGSSKKKTEYSYDKNGRLIADTVKNGDGETTTKYQYDTNNNLVKETRGNKEVDYTYNNADMLLEREESIIDSTTGKIEVQNTYYYRYTPINNLRNRSMILSKNYTAVYEYNADGKIISSSIKIKSNEKNNQDGIINENVKNEYEYNALGLLLNKSTDRKSSYNNNNKENKLTKSYKKSETYLYDYNKANPIVLNSELSVNSSKEERNVVEKNLDDKGKYSKDTSIEDSNDNYIVKNNYVYDNEDKIALLIDMNSDSSSGSTREHESDYDEPYGDGFSICWEDSCKDEYALVTDNQGSVIKAIDSDGKTACEVTYGSFGNIDDLKINEKNSILSKEFEKSDIIPSYTSYLYSDELNLYQDSEIKGYVYTNEESKDLSVDGYNKNTIWYAYERFYSTIDKRFITEDPVVGSIYEPSRVNRYIYAGNNPIKYVDRDGRSFTCEITNNRFFKKAADLVNKVSGVVDKVGQALEPIVKPIAKTVSVINDEFNKLSVQEKVAIGVIGGVVACAMGIGVATVAATMAKSAIGGAVFGAATYGVEALVTGHFDQTELLNSMLVGAADMFMISGVALGVKGVVDCVARNSGRIREAMLANEEGSTNAVDKLDDFYESRVRGKTSYGKSRQKTYQTYTKTNPQTGEVYSGRTSGYGNPAENIRRRDANHHMNRKGFDPAVLDKSSSDYNAIRGREQMLIEKFGGAKSDGGTSGNAINGIGKNNKKKDIYIKSAKKIFGDIK